MRLRPVRSKNLDREQPRRGRLTLCPKGAVKFQRTHACIAQRVNIVTSSTGELECMSDDRDYQAEIEALQKRVEDFWHKCYAKLDVFYVHSTEALRRTIIRDSDEGPGSDPRTPSPK
jgi:hypothetical protein